MNSKLKTALYGTGTFLLPITILALAIWINGLYPLGPKLFIVADLRTQYIDFFAWYRDVLLGNADPFYTTTQALGGSTISMISYYLASPFNALLVLFNEKDIPVFYFVITLLKAGCMQLSIQFFLQRRFSLPRIWASAIGLGFALSIWTVTQLRNPMWMDGLIFLPLCAWGVCCLLRDGRWRLLAVSFGTCVFTNWYMGYMIGLFLCLYMLFEDYMLSYEAVPSGRSTAKRMLLFCGSMFMGLALSAVLFLPSVLSMMSNGTTRSGAVRFSRSHEIIAERFPALANVPMEAIIVAIAIIILCVVALAFWLLRKRSLRFRCSVILFAALMLCLIGCLAMPSFQHSSALDVFRGLAFGTWIYERTPQLFASFLTLILAIYLFFMRQIPLKLKLALGLFLLLLLFSAWLSPLRYIWGGFRIPAGYHSRVSFLFIFMLTWSAAFALRAILNNANTTLNLPRLARKTAVAAAALALVTLGVFVRTTTTLYHFYDNYDQSSIDDYMASATEQIAELEEHDPGVYRVEKTYMRFNEYALNEGMSIGANQIDSYTSTGDASVLSFLSALGFGDDYFFTYVFYPNLAGDSLFGVKYKSSDTTPRGYVDVGLTPIEVPEAKFYENPYALSLAYGVPESIVDFQMPEGTKWECVNAFASALTGHEIAIYPDTSLIQDSQTIEQELDMAAFTQMIDQLKAHQFTFDEFGGSRISGTMNAVEDQMLLMTIPNQAGWSVTVNGDPVEPQDVAEGALMAIPVQPGENHVEMQFMTPGLIPGAIISLSALLFLLLAPRLRRRITCLST